MKTDIRLYYKNQSELGYALRDFIDLYFENKVLDDELENTILSVIDANKDKFYKHEDIAQKPKQILGKNRLNLLYKILDKKGGIGNEKSSYTKQ